MGYDQALLQELNLLIKFPDTSMEGLKIHHSADSSVIGAAERLFDKGLTTQKDGGYLTDLGREAAQSSAQLMSFLTPQ